MSSGNSIFWNFRSSRAGLEEIARTRFFFAVYWGWGWGVEWSQNVTADVAPIRCRRKTKERVGEKTTRGPTRKSLRVEKTYESLKMCSYTRDYNNTARTLPRRVERARARDATKRGNRTHALSIIFLACTHGKRTHCSTVPPVGRLAGKHLEETENANRQFHVYSYVTEWFSKHPRPVFKPGQCDAFDFFSRKITKNNRITFLKYKINFFRFSFS